MPPGGLRRDARAGVVTTAVPSRWSAAAVVAAVVLGGLALPSLAHGPASTDARTDARTLGSGSCGAAVPSSGIHGSVVIDGGPLPASAVGGLGLRYAFAAGYLTVDDSDNLVYASGCTVLNGTATTASNGSFSFDPSLPSSSCTTVDGAMLCTNYTGPYEPVSVALGAAPPAGYAVAINGTPTAGIELTLVYELARVTVDPPGPKVTTSVGAPVEFHAAAWASNGSASDLNVSFAWSVNGTGWSFTGPVDAASVALAAVAGAGVAALTVSVSASVSVAEVGPTAATVDVIAIPTEVALGATNRTALDVGEPMEVELSASGAAGYAYSATIVPGLGLSSVTVGCTDGAAAAGAVTVDCVATVTYPSAGTAQPTANVTNGFSSAGWRFAQVTVRSSPALVVRPLAPVGYALEPVPVTVAAANDTGTPPYAQACLEAPSLPAACQQGPGPAWTFTPAFPLPGNYSATASALDADAVNASLSFVIEVVAPLAVGPIVPSAPNVTAGGSVELTAAVTGGVPPLRYWWNTSRTAGPVATGELDADRTLAMTFAPNASGAWVVTLTVADRLGTAVGNELNLSVGPPAAERILPVGGPPSGPVTAGVAVPLSWGAYELSGAPDRSFSAAAEVVLTGGAGAPEAWVNASGLGALDALGDGAYGVPAAAWTGGALSVNLTVATSTTVSVALAGEALPGPVAAMNLTIEPDRAHLRLFAPAVARAGGRTNATLWHVEDRFGNAVPGALLTIELTFGSSRNAVVVTAFALAGGGSGVWINYSAPTAGSGEVVVVDAAGAVILGPLDVPAAPPPTLSTPTVDAIAAAVPAGTAGAAMFAVARRRRRARAVLPLEEELRRLAEGRARAAELIAAAGAIDLRGLEAAWGAPAPPALADWLASLVADGTVRATVGDDGRPRFCLADRPSRGPRVTVDPEALDRSLRRRDEAVGEPEEDPGGGPR